MPAPGRLTPHLTQTAAWTGACWPLTHSNAITACRSSAQGAWGCRQSPGTEQLPSGSPHASRICREGCGPRDGWARAALEVQNRARPQDLEERSRGHGGFRHSPGKETGDVAVLNTRTPGCPLSRPRPLPA